MTHAEQVGILEYPRMDAAVKARWVAALRSGRYAQGRRMLRSRDDHYCCLGVLCDLVAPQDWTRPGNVYLHEGGDTEPATEVWVAAGLPRLGWHGVQDALIRMNDGSEEMLEPSGASFAEIADWIEANL
jgi:hypothetical protein